MHIELRRDKLLLIVFLENMLMGVPTIMYQRDLLRAAQRHLGRR